MVKTDGRPATAALVIIALIMACLVFSAFFVSPDCCPEKNIPSDGDGISHSMGASEIFTPACALMVNDVRYNGYGPARTVFGRMVFLTAVSSLSAMVWGAALLRPLLCRNGKPFFIKRQDHIILPVGTLAPPISLF